MPMRSDALSPSRYPKGFDGNAFTGLIRAGSGRTAIRIVGDISHGDAEDELRHAISLFYDSAVARFHLGQSLIQRCGPDVGAASLRSALAENPALDEARELG